MIDTSTPRGRALARALARVKRAEDELGNALGKGRERWTRARKNWSAALIHFESLSRQGGTQ